MKYIHNFNWLRGMAACAIAFFHLGTGNARLIPPNNLFNQVTFYGYAGLFIFYVISGTVLPLSMEVGGYRLRDGFRFIGKRMLHIYPPFLASLVLVLFLNFISYMNPAFRGSREWNIERIIGNVFFMGDHFGGWLNIVYWALAVEVQFYLLMVFLYPVVISTCRPPWFAFFLLLQMPTICGWDVVFLKMLPVLLLGVVLYRYLSKRDNFFIFSLCSLFCCVLIGIRCGLPAVIASIATVVIGIIPTRKFSFWEWMGKISLALFLIHVPLGGRIINSAEILHLPMVLNYVVVIGAVVVCVGCAWGFMKITEPFFNSLSRKIHYSGAEQKVPVLAGKNPPVS